MGRGAGVKPVGPNSQLLPKICFASFPYWNINFAVLWSEMIEIWSVLLDADFLRFPSERSETGKPLFSATTCQSFRSFHISFDLLLMIIILSHWEHLYWHRWQWWCWRWQMRLFFELILASMQLVCTSFFQTCDHSHWISLQAEQYYQISL